MLFARVGDLDILEGGERPCSEVKLKKHGLVSSNMILSPTNTKHQLHALLLPGQRLGHLDHGTESRSSQVHPPMGKSDVYVV